eukprot:Pompholyxophrys_punicea_v1_NODE_479_length_1865_cov_65.169061.p1 type:complete len:165 gc:universal NODE_479_length_1865_cov_65.169061:914-1408(+)
MENTLFGEAASIKRPFDEIGLFGLKKKRKKAGWCRIMKIRIFSTICCFSCTRTSPYFKQKACPISLRWTALDRSETRNNFVQAQPRSVQKDGVTGAGLQCTKKEALLRWKNAVPPIQTPTVYLKPSQIPVSNFVSNPASNNRKTKYVLVSLLVKWRLLSSFVRS